MQEEETRYRFYTSMLIVLLLYSGVMFVENSPWRALADLTLPATKKLSGTVYESNQDLKNPFSCLKFGCLDSEKGSQYCSFKIFLGQIMTRHCYCTLLIRMMRLERR